MDPQAPIVRTIVAVDNPISGTGSSQPMVKSGTLATMISAAAGPTVHCSSSIANPTQVADQIPPVAAVVAGEVAAIAIESGMTATATASAGAAAGSAIMSGADSATAATSGGAAATAHTIATVSGRSADAATAAGAAAGAAIVSGASKRGAATDGPNRGVAQGQQFGGLEQRVRKGSAFHAVAAEQTFAGETGSFQRTARKKSTAATGAGKVSTYGGYAGQTRKGFGAKQVQKVLRLSPEQHAQLRDFQRPVKVTIFGFDEDDVDEVAELIKDAGKHQKLQLPPPVSPATTKILEQHLGQQAASALPGPAASTSAGPPPPPKPTLTASGGPLFDVECKKVMFTVSTLPTTRGELKRLAAITGAQDYDMAVLVVQGNTPRLILSGPGNKDHHVVTWQLCNKSICICCWIADGQFNALLGRPGTDRTGEQCTQNLN